MTYGISRKMNGTIGAGWLACVAVLAGFAPPPALAQGTTGAPDHITVGMRLEPPNLDPTAGAAAAIDEVVYANVFEGLTRFAPDGTIVPGLAERWEVSANGRVWTFHLRAGVSFHDGSGLDAQDVVFSLNRARAADSTNAQKELFANIESVSALAPLIAQVTLNRPDGDFAFNLAWGDAVIVAPESAASNASAPVGTGPFMFDRWVRGDRIEIVANPAYWGQPPALASATFKFIADPNAAFAALMSGAVNAFPIFPAPELLATFQADPRFSVIVGSTEGETIVAMNNKAGPLADIRVRQAIAHAIDRDAIIEGAMFGYGTPIGTHFAPHNPDYVDLIALSPHDPDKARRLLAIAGFDAGGRPLRVRLMLPPPAYARRGGEIVASQLRAVGIETTITNLEWAQWLEQVFRNKDYDLTIVSHTEPADISIYARPDYYFQYDNPVFQSLMEELARTDEPDARSGLLARAQTILAEDYVNAYLFQLAKTGVADARVSGLWQNAPTPANDLTGVRWIE